MNDHIGKPIDLNDVIHTLLRYCTPRAVTAVETASVTDKHAIAPEFAFENALNRMGGNRALFIRLVTQFGDAARAVIADFADSLRRNENAQAAAAMHTLAGLASSIGAVRMAAHAVKTEARLYHPETHIPVNSTIRIFDVLARRTQDALRTFAAQDRFAPAAIAQSEAASDPSLLPLRLAELDTLLRSANMRALQVFSQLEGMIGSENNAHLLTLKQAVNSLDFKRALECSQQLRASLGVANH
jgi:HPt (histidine-containing phosphotransfer) domain-containing protein